MKKLIWMLLVVVLIGCASTGNVADDDDDDGIGIKIIHGIGQLLHGMGDGMANGAKSSPDPIHCNSWTSGNSTSTNCN